MLNIQNVTKKFKTTVLNDITISFPKQTVSVIVGINGIGKTTLLDCIVDLKKINNGSIAIDGHPNDSKAFKARIFYLPSEFYLPNFMTGREYLHFVLSRYDNARKDLIADFLNIFDLTTAADHLLEAYSFGMKKKIQLIAATLSNTEYILGDEIFTGLDFETTLVTLELFDKLADNAGIIIVSHNKAIIEKFSDNILLLSDGKLLPFLGTIDDLEKEVLNMEKVNEKIEFVKGYRFIN